MCKETNVDHHSVLQNKLHHVHLKLGQKGLTWVVHQWHHHLKDPCHVVQHKMVTLGLYKK